MRSHSLLPPASETIVEVFYPAGTGTIGLRGSHAPLSWDHTEPPAERIGDRHVFRVPVPPGEVLELKVVRDEDRWSAGRNYALHAGDHLAIQPSFDRDRTRLEPGKSLKGLSFDVLLPPTYDEQTEKRYPVLYALDGQALWSTSADPFGVWSLETTFDLLYELGALNECIVIGLRTAEDRLGLLTPTADPEHGGGGAAEFLRSIVEDLRPHVASEYRVLEGREHTMLLGSSLGGLFAFYAAWARPDVFGKAACLSPSFWWGNRWLVRMVQEKPLPEPRPELYIDSGAAVQAHERDVNARDGFHDTRAMLRALLGRGYTLGADLHRLVFAGATHDAGAWSARVQIPLQILLPPPLPRPPPAAETIA